MRFVTLSFLFISFYVQAESNTHLKPSCFGDPMPNFELPQFGPVRDQTPEGTCYAYSAAAEIEAAIFRQTGVKRTLSTEYLAVNQCVANAHRQRSPGKTDIDSRTKELSPSDETDDSVSLAQFLDGGSPSWSVESILNSQRAPWDLPDHHDALRKDYDDFRAKAAKASLTAQGKATLLKADALPGLQIQLQQIQQAINKTVLEYPDVPNPDGLKPEEQKKFDVVEAKLDNLQNDKIKIETQIQQIRDDTQALFDASSREICDNGHCFMKKFQTDANSSSDLSDFEFVPAQVEPRNESDMKAKNGRCTSDYNSRVIKSVMRSLCVGVPLTTGIDPTKLLGLDKNAWKKTQLAGGHAVTITGVRTINGEPYFTFRNSWGGRFPELALPFKEACHLSSVGTVLDRVTVGNESMAEAKAWIDSTMDSPRNPEQSAAREFFKSRLNAGRLIKVVDVEAFKPEVNSGDGAPAASHSDLTPASQ